MVKPMLTSIFMVYYGHPSSLPSRNKAKDPSDLESSSKRKAEVVKRNQEERKQRIKAIRREGKKAKEAASIAARTYPHQTTTSKGTFWRIRTRENRTWIFDHEPTRWERYKMLAQEITDPSIQATMRSEVRPGGLLWFYHQWAMTERETKKKKKMEKNLARKEKKAEEKAKKNLEKLAREAEKGKKKTMKKAAKDANREGVHDSYKRDAWTTKATTEKWNMAADLRAMKASTKAEYDEVLAAMWPLRRCPGRG